MNAERRTTLDTYGNIIIALTSTSSRRRRGRGISHHDVTAIDVVVCPVNAGSSQHRYRPSRATALEPSSGPDQATVCIVHRVQSLEPFDPTYLACEL